MQFLLHKRWKPAIEISHGPDKKKLDQNPDHEPIPVECHDFNLVSQSWKCVKQLLITFPFAIIQQISW